MVARTVLPPPDSDEARWLHARWRALHRAASAAPREWHAWANRELTADPLGEALAALGETLALGEAVGASASRGDAPSGAAAAPLREGADDAYDRSRDAASRVALGMVFTPAPIAALVARMAGCGESEADWPDPTALDPACGDGSLLRAAAERRRGAGWGTASVLEALEGWDADPRAAWSCRATLVEWALQDVSGPVPAPLRVFGGVDGLGQEGPPGDLLARRGRFGRGVGAVLSNPPYLEAKRMRAAAPGLRERLRRAFPQLHGAFDLYLAFCWRALEQLEPGGRAVLLLPNKVLQGRYAARFRRRILGLDEADVLLTQLADLARTQPRPFPGTGVYPVVLRLDRGVCGSTFAGHRVSKHDELEVPVEQWAPTALAPLRRIGGDHPIFVPFPSTWPALAPLLEGPRLDEVARVSSTCSFHARGLREQFVAPDRPATHAHPYVGGPSRARRTEVSPFRLEWAGWWICFDQDRLRTEHRNPLPDLHRVFLRPKVVLCQHAPRMRVYADFEGRYVTKDVYPVAAPAHPAWTVGRLAAVLQSTVFTALYNTLYQGIVVGGETYHYLPAFLHRVPVPEGGHPALAEADAMVEALQAGGGPVDGALWDALDRRVAEAYGVDEADRQRMIEVHLRRVGAECPG